MKARTIYQCPVCRREFDTKRKATACAKPIKFKRYDIIFDKNNSRVWRVLDVSSGMMALDREMKWVLLRGFDPSWQKKSISVHAFNCNDRYVLLTRAHIEGYMKKRVKQVRAGELLLKVVPK